MNNEETLGKKALAKGWIRSEQLSQCLEQQKALLKQDRQYTLQQIFLHYKYLSPQQIQILSQESFVSEDDSVIQNPQTFSHYQIVSEIGRGGMGVVYRALDTRLNRTVALKTLISSEGEESDIKRFLQEARTCAKLKHPHIINVLDVDIFNEQYFLSMDFIQGNSLQTMIRKSGMGIKNTTEIMIKVAKAMDYAHKEGVIHRDLKPANIMIDQNNEPKVMDFGLAMLADESAKLSKTGLVMGTLCYMPPEQLEAKRDQIDRRSDVYALGAIMYEMLTGKTAFSGNHMKLVYLIGHEKPTPLRHIRSHIPKELEYITLKAMEKKPEDRYATAMEMAKDLERYEQGESFGKSVLLSFGSSGPSKAKKTSKFLIYLFVTTILLSFFSFWLGKQVKLNFLKMETPQHWSQEMWLKCWDPKQMWLDFTKDCWQKLSPQKQQIYSQSYQKWYAKKMLLQPEILFKTHYCSLPMVLVPPGKFWMGSSLEKKDMLRHQVGIYRPFYICKYEITQQQWFQVMGELPKGLLASKKPVHSVSWEKSRIFCFRLGLQLPSEAQWEYAAKAGIDVKTTFKENFAKKHRGPVDVGTYKNANNWGVYDLQDNVREWCMDFASLYTAKEKKFISSNSYIDSYIEPVSFMGSGHINRGGSWKDLRQACQKTARHCSLQAQDFIGVRPIQVLLEIPKKFPKGRWGTLPSKLFAEAKVVNSIVRLKNMKLTREARENFWELKYARGLNFSFSLQKIPRLWLVLEIQSVHKEQHINISINQTLLKKDFFVSFHKKQIVLGLPYFLIKKDTNAMAIEISKKEDGFCRLYKVKLLISDME